jgi:hypothetical protein
MDQEYQTLRTHPLTNILCSLQQSNSFAAIGAFFVAPLLALVFWPNNVDSSEKVTIIIQSPCLIVELALETNNKHGIRHHYAK